MRNFKTLTVYLGSSGYCRSVFQDSAILLGKTIAREKRALVYGGMDAGLMGILAKSALEEGGDVTGIIPRRLKDSERILDGLSETILVEELWERKKKMFERADAVIALPGGFGTVDESLEMLYWASQHLHHKPLVMINIEGFWNPLLVYLKTLPDFDARYLIFVDAVEDVFPALEAWNAPDVPENPSEHYPHFEDEILRATDQPIIIDQATLESTYFATCALGLKQLGKHSRGIGFLNEYGRFDALLAWIQLAAKETFITEKCLSLFVSSDNKETLRTLLKKQHTVDIDLHHEKWGNELPTEKS